MRRCLRWGTLAIAGAALAAAPAGAAVQFFGTAKIKPTFYSNFDFDSSKGDVATLNEAGWASGEHIRAELRLGWKAAGDNWRIKMIAEADVIYEKDTGDRSFYAGAEKEKQPNTGGEFGIERAEFIYTFSPKFELETGWDVRFLDLRTGGLLYGDDHPFLGFRGKLTDQFGYEFLYMPIYNRDKIKVSDNWKDRDWRVYSLKMTGDINVGTGKISLSPFVAYSDFERPRNTEGGRVRNDADIYYYGAELYGQIGFIKPMAEFVYATGEFQDTNKDISAWAAFAGAEAALTKAFTPYAAFRYTSGDDDKSDNDVKGWVGITDIARFTPMLGMDGNILGEHLSTGASPYGAPLYSYSPENAVGGNEYGGIGTGGSGNNPGQRLVAVGAKGDLSQFLPKLSYKTQVFFIWYDQTDNLTNKKNPGEKVDEYAGTTFDLQLKYKFSKNFSIDNIFSAFVPGQGIEDQVDANDTAWLNMLTLAWAY